MSYNGGIQVPIVQVRLEQSAAAQFAKQGIQLKIKQKHFIDKSSRPETHCLLVFAIVSGEVRHTVYKWAWDNRRKYILSGIAHFTSAEDKAALNENTQL